MTNITHAKFTRAADVGLRKFSCFKKMNYTTFQSYVFFNKKQCHLFKITNNEIQIVKIILYLKISFCDIDVKVLEKNYIYDNDLNVNNK